MPTRVDLHIDTTRDALQAKLASLNRALNNQPNKLIRDILTKDLQAMQNAINTLTEVK